MAQVDSIYEKKLRSKITWACPLKATWGEDALFKKMLHFDPEILQPSRLTTLPVYLFSGSPSLGNIFPQENYTVYTTLYTCMIYGN